MPTNGQNDLKFGHNMYYVWPIWPPPNTDKTSKGRLKIPALKLCFLAREKIINQ